MAENNPKSNRGKIERTPKKQPKKLNPNLILRKRQPVKPQTGPNVIYVSSKTSTKCLLERCSKLIANNHKEIILYCLGAAIQQGILLALQVCERHINFQCETKTFTTTLIDDLEPVVDEADYEIQKRINSALKIRIFCIDPLEQSTSSDVKR
ncbi:hypothetical protein ABEB36_010061 [Hypothenemus hampei]|uniref:Uncharacterized protein n=1 Tax=Hypothenemus hampei TaxID=57062 RepID=A0ABD1EIE1_HYPHA